MIRGSWVTRRVGPGKYYVDRRLLRSDRLVSSPFRISRYSSFRVASAYSISGRSVGLPLQHSAIKFWTRVEMTSMDRRRRQQLRVDRPDAADRDASGLSWFTQTRCIRSSGEITPKGLSRYMICHRINAKKTCRTIRCIVSLVQLRGPL